MTRPAPLLALALLGCATDPAPPSAFAPDLATASAEDLARTSSPMDSATVADLALPVALDFATALPDLAEPARACLAPGDSCAGRAIECCPPRAICGAVTCEKDPDGGVNCVFICRSVAGEPCNAHDHCQSGTCRAGICD